MISKKILISSAVFIFCFGPALPVFAAHLVPIPNALQPIPSNVGPNVSNNINTPGNDFSKTQQKVSADQIKPQPEQPVPASVSAPAVPDQTTEASAEITQQVFRYWSLLVFGILGILIIGAWVYFRFIRKPKNLK